MRGIAASNPTFRNFTGEMGSDWSTVDFGNTNSSFDDPLSNFDVPSFNPSVSNPNTWNDGYTPTPVYSPSYTPSPQKSGTSLTLQDILQNATGIGSQIISAFGKNPSTQILTGSGALKPIQPQTQNPYGTAGQTPEAIAAANLAAARAAANTNGVGTSAVNTAGGFLDGIAQSFGISTATLTIVGVVGAVLYFRDPKKK